MMGRSDSADERTTQNWLLNILDAEVAAGRGAR